MINKNNEYNFDNILYENDELHLLDNRYCLSDVDFYPPSDNRTLKSYTRDINGGDTFADYCEYIFKLYEEEGYWD